MVDGGNGTGTGTGKQLHDGSSGLGATAVTFPLVSPWSLHTPLLSFKHIFTLQYANLPQRVVVIKNLFQCFNLAIPGFTACTRYVFDKNPPVVNFFAFHNWWSTTNWQVF